MVTRPWPGVPKRQGPARSGISLWRFQRLVNSEGCRSTLKLSHQRRPADASRLERLVGPLVHYFCATASNAFGLVLAIANNVRAAPLGCLRPCSHPCSVRTETPMSAANCD